MTNRRDFYRLGTFALGSLMGLVLAVPGVAYLLDPLSKRRGSAKGQGGDDEFHTLVRLSELTPKVPRAFPIIEERQDAWVKYPREPVGSVWVIRQPDGAEPPVIAYSAECPHLGCSVGLSGDGRSFLCPCHTSAFEFDGKRKNEVPPRGMDRLEVKLSTDPDPEVRVKFERFRTMEKEQIPLG
jgi:menaquinol-cytochrome c reductase iron-sulfur subunit